MDFNYDAPQQKSTYAFVAYADASDNSRNDNSQSSYWRNFDFVRESQLASSSGGSSASDAGNKLQDYGSIQSMELPAGYSAHKPAGDAGYLNLAENDPRLFESKNSSDTNIGAWHSNFSNNISADLKAIQSKPPHSLTDEEYFKINAIMAPGAWSGDGRNHELGMRSEEINGKKAFVYDYWKTADRSRDSFNAKPGPDDIKGRVVFFPDANTGKVDVMWMQSPVSQFDKNAADFDRSLRSIKWK